MKKVILICGLLCLIIAGCNTFEHPIIQTSKEPHATDVDNDNPSAKTPSSNPTYKKTYIEAYTDFLLNPYIEPDNDTGFPIRGYYLFDLDFDDIPELGVLHDSLGSMGSYFTYYRFDGDNIIPIVDGGYSPARATSSTQVLADFENKKVYFLKEMSLLQGNVNGTYGYIRELVIQDGTPYIHSVLDLRVDQESDLDKHVGKKYHSEDDYLSDTELDECLITRYYTSDGWEDISSADYLKLKRELIPADSTFTDLRDTDICHIGTSDDMLDYTEGKLRNIQISPEEIEVLFSKWLKY